jgi:asparagine synthase (glutamine-hydrolysing)
LDFGINSLTHRGPDQQGKYESREISLGATRLRILDMQGGEQPFRSPDGDVVVVFNGEIFNHAELKVELQSCGFNFSTQCDTEVALNAFLHWGRNCLCLFRGMFSIGIWQQSERTMLLARDPVGIKPLYYFLHGKDIFFGSELKCILAHPSVPRHLDTEALNCYLALNYVPGPNTLVQGIRKLPPGHLLEWRSGRSRISRYLATPAAQRPVVSMADACEQLDCLLKDSVREQLVSDVPVGVWLSGGLDSSTILHYASQASSKPLKTFSVTFRGRSFDEGPYIKQVSRQYGTQHAEVDLSPDEDLANAIDSISYFSDEPGADSGALPLWYLSKLTKGNVKVVLSGEGADELFGGYLTYRANQLHSLTGLFPARLRSMAFAAACHLPVSDEKIGLEYKLKRFLAGSMLAPEAAHLFWNGTFSDGQRKAIYHHFSADPMRSLFAEIAKPLCLQSYLDFDQKYFLPDNILYKVDRISMAHSIEVRPPFLDTRILAFAAHLPPAYKLSALESKRVLRRLMANKLPPSVLKRPKIGFDVPIHDWFRGPLRDYLLDVVSEKRIVQTGLFSWQSISRLIHAHLERKINVGYHLWGLMTCLLWMERWQIQMPSRTRSREVAFDEPCVALMEASG